MAEHEEARVYGMIGEAGFEKLAQAFYGRVAGDDVLRPMYPAEEAEFMAGRERLKEFLVYRFGGPPRYIEARGHPRLRMRHAAFAVDQAARDRWVKLMDEALAEAALPAEAEAILRGFFASTATFLINRGK